MEFVPRRKSDVTVPGPPDCTTSRPGTVRRRSRTVVAFDAAISAASITVAATPRDAADSGSASAETTTSAASFVAPAAARAGRREAARHRRQEQGTRRPGERRRGTPWNTSVPLAPPSHRKGGGVSGRTPERPRLPEPRRRRCEKRCSSGRSPGSRIVRARPLPGGATGLGTDLSPPVDLAGRVPGHSGGGRAGISPASLFTQARTGAHARPPEVDNFQGTRGR